MQVLIFSCVFLLMCYVCARNIDQNVFPVFDETNSDHWKLQAQWTLKTKLKAQPNTRIATNVIFFVGDGMSLATLAATRTYLGQKHGRTGEDIKLSFETAPYTGLAKTYCVDSNVADSACSGTAYMTGVKANIGTLGLRASARRGSCVDQRKQANRVNSIIQWAQDAGKATGVVTNTRVTHATPASSYAHAADRRWESDTDLPMYVGQCDDIALQLVKGDVGRNIDVIMGGGRKNFFSKSKRDDEGLAGYRSDGKNLINEWLEEKKSQGRSPKYVIDRDELMKVNVDKYDTLLGLFSPDHMPYHLDADLSEDPTITEMTLKAIKMLSKEDNGYFLFVESGRIDTAHHENKARKALDETAELAKAVEATLKVVDLSNTLVVVTSDHAHAMLYNGYSKRGTDILGLATNQHFADHNNASDGLPYTILNYGSGPGYKSSNNDVRHNVASDNLDDVNYEFPALVPLKRAAHGGEDVAVFAQGPWAHLFTGSFEQNYIPHAMAFASCIGSGLTACSLS